MASDREKVKRAIAAMRGLGISDEKTKTVLGKLLKVYDKNWDLIEGESYRVLADAIFQDEEEGDMGGHLDNKSNSDGEENGTGDEHVPPLRMPERRNTRQVAEEKMNSNSQEEVKIRAAQMGYWEYEQMSLEELMRIIKGFIDIVILGSGYQSSGLPAHWDSLAILKAFQFSLFFHHAINRLSESDLKELDSALSQLTKDPSFPKGLAHVSLTTLKNARDFVLEILLHNLPLRSDHLKALLTAAAEMELDERSHSGCSCLNFVHKVVLSSTYVNPFVDGKSPVVDFTKKREDCMDECLIKFTTQELMRRQSAVACISTVGTALNLITDSIGCCSQNTESYLLKYGIDQDKGPGEDKLINFVTWSKWKSRSLSYFLDSRTLRLVSGASILFSTPKSQWVQVFKRLNVSASHNNTNFSEAIELLLLGCIASQWTKIIEHFTSISFDSTSISKQFLSVYNLLSGVYPSSYSNNDVADPKELGMLEYLTELLIGQLHHLWDLAPALVAVAVPSWSALFKLYLTDLEAHFKGAHSTIRCCSCPPYKGEHTECDLAERIWCLYTFHVRGFHNVDKA